MKMLCSEFGSTPIILLLMLLVGAQAGLVHRKIRNENLNAPVATENLIPVQIIQDGEQLDRDPIKVQPTQKVIKTEEPKKTTLLTGEVKAPEPEPDAAAAEKIVETAADMNAASSLLDKERQEDEIIIDQEIKQAIAEENKELLQAEKAAMAASLSSQDINIDPKYEVPAAANAAATAIYFSAPETPNTELGAAPEEIQSSTDQLKSASLIADSATAESQNVAAGSDTESNLAGSPAIVVVVDDTHAPVDLVRQAAATQATPTQATTQQNFVQQLIQSSPIGQFFGQLTGQQASQDTQVAADQPATPAPTLPGFLNPQNAITQVQNAAQSVANATAQAFQGVQQFATNLGTQFQNTLSSLGGQPQSTSDSTTTRPPGPIQSLISNFVGGNPPGSSAAAAVGATQNPAQQQGPLQGIISFFQGGNRPQTSAVAGSGGSAAAVAPAPANDQPAQLNNKVDEVNKDDQTNELTDAAQEQEETDQTDNEVRNSAEVAGVDSLEDNASGQFIIVNDDASQQEQRGNVKEAVAV